ncbi:hypothetical protein [Devosia faecipullorum]|uniref:hypothetical protein n=1 Tax=Devosia faecipullorum TaxID=2755039 RepID=UPI00187B8788|nr:hypothetical protein [Devosia faecipullorum]MBE7733307.1 hypothetical protein [Devosia faecipullorum]
MPLSACANATGSGTQAPCQSAVKRINPLKLKDLITNQRRPKVSSGMAPGKKPPKNSATTSMLLIF